MGDGTIYWHSERIRSELRVHHHVFLKLISVFRRMGPFKLEAYLAGRRTCNFSLYVRYSPRWRTFSEVK